MRPSQPRHNRKSKKPKYRYKTLEPWEIRLLTLLPDSFDAKIQISMGTLDFDSGETPMYEALSYAWGSTETPLDIEITGSRGGTLAVTENLDIALRHLRSKRKPRTLWIDAISINQKDPEECGHQVRHMATIYKRASRVVVWLGPEDKESNSTEAMDLLRDVASKVIVNWTLYQGQNSNPSEDWGKYTKSMLQVKKYALALNSLLYRSWFERLWIQQEVYCANSQSIILCGHEEMSWYAFRDATFCVCVKAREMQDSFKLEYRHLFNRLSLLQNLICFNPGTGYSWWAVLERSHLCVCKDPRDKIYGIIGMIKESERNINFEVNYRLSVQEVYRDFFLAVVQHNRDLDLFAFCDKAKPRPAGIWPSWIPDWSRPLRVNILRHHFLGSVTVAVAKKSDRPHILEASGVRFGTIKATIEPHWDVPHALSDSQKMADIIRQVVRSINLQSTYVDGRSMLEALCRCFGCDLFGDFYFPETQTYPSLREGYNFLLEMILKEYSSSSATAFDEQVHGSYLSLVHAYAFRRNFFFTNEGYMGLAPDTAKVGDQVCIILGSSAPVLLRPTPNGQYEVIGECYVQSAMNLEPLFGHLPLEYNIVREYLEWSGSRFLKYLNHTTGQRTDHDPRVPHLSSEEYSKPSQGARLSYSFTEAMFSKEALAVRGVKLLDLELV